MFYVWVWLVSDWWTFNESSKCSYIVNTDAMNILEMFHNWVKQLNWTSIKVETYFYVQHNAQYHILGNMDLIICCISYQGRHHGMPLQPFSQAPTAFWILIDSDEFVLFVSY